MDCQYEEKAMSHTAEEIDKAVEQSTTNANEIYALKEYAFQIIQNDLNSLKQNKADTETVEELKQEISELNQDAENKYTKSEVDEKLDNKVEKTEGKDLSTNDFTNDYKDKVDNTYTKVETDKLISELESDISEEHNKNEEIYNTLNNKIDDTDHFDTFDARKTTYNNESIAYNGYMHISRYGYGTKETACGLGVLMNSNGAPQVINTDTKGLAAYRDRDAVGVYVSCDPVSAGHIVEYENLEYTETGVNFLSPIDFEIYEGMILDTETKTFVGIVKSYNLESGVIVLEDGWRSTTSPYDNGIPSETDNLIISKTTKVWGVNVNVSTIENEETNAAAIEAGLYDNGSTGQDKGLFDGVVLKGHGDYGVRVRASGSSTLYYGVLIKKPTIGVSVQQNSSGNIAFESLSQDYEKFVILNNGKMNRTVKKVSLTGTGTIGTDHNIIICEQNNATITLPAKSPIGIVYEIFSTGYKITLETNSETEEKIWYSGGTNNSVTITEATHKWFKLIKYDATTWLISYTNLAKLDLKDTEKIANTNTNTMQDLTLGYKCINLLSVNSKTLTSTSGGYAIGTNSNHFKINLPKGKYTLSWTGTATSGVSELTLFSGDTSVSQQISNVAGENKMTLDLSTDIDAITLYCNKANEITNMMLVSSAAGNVTEFQPYTKNVYDYLKYLEEKITALENTQASQTN